MPVSGLVVSLKSDPRLREEAINAIRGDSRIEVGAIEGRRMAVILDTDSSDDDNRIWCWLGSLPGVTAVGLDEREQRSGSDDSLQRRSPPCNDLKYV